ncbi:MAG: BON domain-containing protein [Nitrospiraceae bacterium]
MFSISKFSVVLSCAALALLGALSGCQSTTGKTASQTMSDSSITTAVQTKLTSDRLSNFPRIDVDTERGVVNLSGVVETEAHRARAERLAHQVNGVVRVNNNLQIQNRLPSEKQTNPAHAQDTKAAQPERNSGEQQERAMQTEGVSIIQGDVVRVEGNTYFVKGRDGKEISLHADNTTMKTSTIKSGDRVEIKLDQNNHALSMLPAP